MKYLFFAFLFVLPVNGMEVPTPSYHLCHETVASSVMIKSACNHVYPLDILTGIVLSGGVLCPRCDEPLSIAIQEKDGYMYVDGNKIIDDVAVAQLLTCRQVLEQVRPRVEVVEGECPICMEELSTDVRHTTSCSHTFHMACFARWMAIGTDPKCPLCNGKIDRASFAEERARPRVVDEEDRTEQIRADERLARQLQEQERPFPALAADMRYYDAERRLVEARARRLEEEERPFPALATDMRYYDAERRLAEARAHQMAADTEIMYDALAPILSSSSSFY